MRPADGFWWDHPSVTQGMTPARRHALLYRLRGDTRAITSAVLASMPASLPTTHSPADWATISAAAGAGMALGVHSVTHRNLTQLDDEEPGVGARDRVERISGNSAESKRPALPIRTGISDSEYAMPCAEKGIVPP